MCANRYRSKLLCLINHRDGLGYWSRKHSGSETRMRDDARTDSRAANPKVMYSKCAAVELPENPIPAQRQRMLCRLSGCLSTAVSHKKEGCA